MEYVDFVFPNGNEEKLVQMAKRLGFAKLILCYPLKDPMIRDRAKEVAKLSAERFTAVFAILVQNPADVDKARSISKDIIAIASPAVFEDKRIPYVLDFESGTRDDFIHHRNSGLNQVFIEQAKRTGKTLLVDAGQLLRGELPQAVVLGRMQQNNMFFKKYKPNVLVVSCASEPLEMRAPRDMENLLHI